MRPEKPWGYDDGRGFDSRHLHYYEGLREMAEILFAKWRTAACAAVLCLYFEPEFLLKVLSAWRGER